MIPLILACEDADELPRFTTASFLPEQGMMLFQIRAVLPGRGEVDLVASPDIIQAERALAAGGANAAFSFGGAFLAPFANRIRGRAGSDRTIRFEADGRAMRLPANWSGKAPGAEAYAMHGLILDRAFEVVRRTSDSFEALLKAGDFGGWWPSSVELTLEARLRPAVLNLSIHARNVGQERTPIGIGWHPYLALPSGRRPQARLHVAARRRLEVEDYDGVLPTGRILAVKGTAHDFSRKQGAALGDLYLDDCFVDLAPADGVVAAVFDPAADIRLTFRAAAPPVRAVQIYAPPDKDFVVVEPQFNWPDPFGRLWPSGVDTGMAWLNPGQETRYAVALGLGPVSPPGPGS